MVGASERQMAKCPLLLIGAYASAEALAEKATECLEEQCTWWDEGEEDCALYLILKSLRKEPIKTKE